MLATLYKSLSVAADLLLPPRQTERAVRLLTSDILEELAAIQGALPYHEPRVRALVWELKYRRNPLALSLAGQFLAERALCIAEECVGKPVLIPVPMHPARRAQRGYNQCELLCEAVLRTAPNSFSYEPHALERVRNTPSQQGLPRHRRLKNMLGAIEVVHTEKISGKTCIVIDDVSTTGATLHETKRALLEGGAERVHIITLAHS